MNHCILFRIKWPPLWICSRLKPMLSVLPNVIMWSYLARHTVTISGPEYRGVLLEARTAGSTSALGSWRLPPPDTKFLLVRPEQSGSCWNWCSCGRHDCVFLGSLMNLWVVFWEPTRCHHSFQHQPKGQRHDVQLDPSKLYQADLLQVMFLIFRCVTCWTCAQELHL